MDTVDHLSRFFTSPRGTDVGLSLLQYTLQLTTGWHGNQQRDKHAADLARFSELISDARILLRLFGMAGIYSWAKAHFQSNTRDPIVTLQIMANAAFQPLENLAYLSMHKVIRISADTEAQLWAWSCRFWAVHVVLELVRLMRQRKRTVRSKDWTLQVVNNLGWLPLTAHWSLLKGLPGFTDAQVGFFGTIAAISDAQMLWNTTS